MRTTVVSGMLGSGKTTFIGHLLRQSRERTVVLVNDFGALGIDGEIFSAQGIEAVELPSGCVCCTLRFDLVAAVERIRSSFAPEHLVIEPSGVASPSGVLEALEGAGVGAVSVVGIVDATEFLELHTAELFGTFFRDQIVNADVILVNKTDLAEERITRGTVQTVEAMNPAAIVVCTVQAHLDAPLPKIRRGREPAPGRQARIHFDTVSCKLAAGTPLAAVQRLLRACSRGRYGEVVRAKALVATDRGPWRFDLAFGNLAAGPFPQPIADGRMVVIGQGLDVAAIEREARRASRKVTQAG